MTNILKFPDPLLLNPTTPFDFANPPISPEEITNLLIKTVHDHNGMGLSANQIGLPYSVLVVKSNPNIVMFNPKIVYFSDKEIPLDEGCLSYPGLLVKIKRAEEIRVRFQVPSGVTTTKPFVGLTSRVIQHEVDHLNGIPFYNRASLYHREQAFRKLKNEQRKAR